MPLQLSLALVISAALFTSAFAESDNDVDNNVAKVITGPDGDAIHFPLRTPEELFEHAMSLGAGQGHTFDTMSSSYGRLLTTLIGLGLTETEINVVIPLFAAKKGVTVGPNPSRSEEAERCRWQPTLDEDVQRLQDTIFARDQTMQHFFGALGWDDNGARGADVSAFELLDQFDVETDRSLASIHRTWVQQRNQAEENLQKGVTATERAYFVGVREHTYDYQNERWATQCRSSLARFEAVWRSLIPRPDDAAGGNYSEAIMSALLTASARVTRRGLAVAVTDVLANTPNAPQWLSELGQSFRRLTTVSPALGPEGRVHVVHTDNVGEAPGPARVKASTEDITRSMCAFYHSLRLIIDSNAQQATHATPETMGALRRLINHFRSSVSRVVPEHVSAFLNADVVVVDGVWHRYGPAVAKVVFDEVKRSLPGTADVVDFDRFYRSVFEESHFFAQSMKELIVRSLARDVPPGSVVIIAYPVRECREVVHANGTVVAAPHECVALSDQMGAIVRAIDPEPFVSLRASRHFEFDGPIGSAPRDSPARFRPSVDPDFEVPEGQPTYRLRTDYIVEAFQWGAPRQLAAEEAEPFFGEEVEALMRAERDAAKGFQAPPSAEADAEEEEPAEEDVTAQAEVTQAGNSESEEL
jgi:hypothetical protein